MERESFEPADMELLECAEIIDRETKQRCNATAEILGRYVVASTDGEIEHIRTMCLEGHNLEGPTSILNLDNLEAHNDEAEIQEDIA